MQKRIDSDNTPAMLASKAFETIIDNIRDSTLNFQLQMSPFSALISLKKTLVTEKSGVSRLPPAVHALISTPDTNNRERNRQQQMMREYLEKPLFKWGQNWMKTNFQ